MCIVLHCRVLFWCTSSLYISWYTPLYISCLTFTLMQCLFGSLQSLDGGLTINYQPILFQANLLSCLSTAMGLVHEPPLPNGVVNLQQPKFGTQCGAHGRWTGPQTYRCNTQLLGDIASHCPLRRQYQLAHVGQLAAKAKSHTKTNFSQQKNTSECMTFGVKLTGQHWAVLNTITHTNSAIVQEDSAQLPMGDTVTSIAATHSVPRGEHGDHKEPHNKEGSSTNILRQTGSLSREVVPGPTCEDEDCTVNLVIVPGALNSNSARGTEHLWWHGHM